MVIFSDNYYRQGSIGNRIRYWLARYYVLSRADRIRVVGERIKQSLLNIGIQENKVEVRSIPVEVEKIRAYVPKFNLRERYPDYTKIFLCLGRLDPVKNLPWLIELFADIVKEKPSFLLLIVGDGPERPRLEALVKAKKLEYTVKFEGWTSDPWSYLKTADTLLFPACRKGMDWS